MLGDVLKSVRVKKGIKQDTMAGLLKITRQSYGAYERNVSMPDIVTLAKIADFFEVSTDYLLGTNYSKLQSENEMKNVPLDDFSHKQSVANKLMLLQGDDFNAVEHIINTMAKK